MDIGNKDKIFLEKSERKPIDNMENFEAEQNWLGFWNLILKEDMRQNPEYYKKFKEENDENNENTNKFHKA